MTYRKSSWSFNTSAGAGIGLGPFSISRGMLVLNEPDGKEFRQFKYSTFGMGLKSFRLPERFQLPGIPLPRGHELSGSASTTDFWSDGIIFMNQTFHGRELTLQDFSGGVFVEDAGGGVLIARHYTLMHVGVPNALMLASFANPAFLAVALNAAKAIIIMEGVSEGLIDGAGITSSIGMLTYEGRYSG
jgi:hypothetical protein